MNSHSRDLPWLGAFTDNVSHWRQSVGFLDDLIKVGEITEGAAVKALVIRSTDKVVHLVKSLILKIETKHLLTISIYFLRKKKENLLNYSEKISNNKLL